MLCAHFNFINPPKNLANPPPLVPVPVAVGAALAIASRSPFSQALEASRRSITASGSASGSASRGGGLARFFGGFIELK